MGDSGNNSLLSVIFWNGPVLAMPLVSLVYPLYASIRSIETRCCEDDQQWLTYWVLHSLISLFELTFYRALEWLPFWPLLKILAVCWLVLPFFNGASYVYEVFVRPFYWNPVIRITYVPKMNRVFSRPDWFVPASERYSEENRLGAYERMARVDREARARRSSHMMTYDHGYHDYLWILMLYRIVLKLLVHGLFLDMEVCSRMFRCMHCRICSQTSNLCCIICS